MVTDALAAGPTTSLVFEQCWDSPKMSAQARVPVGRAAVFRWTRTAIVLGFSWNAAAPGTEIRGSEYRNPPIDGQCEVPEVANLVT
jgi:hypothetical protein